MKRWALLVVLLYGAMLLVLAGPVIMAAAVPYVVDITGLWRELAKEFWLVWPLWAWCGVWMVRPLCWWCPSASREAGRYAGGISSGRSWPLSSPPP